MRPYKSKQKFNIPRCLAQLNDTDKLINNSCWIRRFDRLEVVRCKPDVFGLWRDHIAITLQTFGSMQGQNLVHHQRTRMAGVVLWHFMRWTPTNRYCYKLYLKYVVFLFISYFADFCQTDTNHTSVCWKVSRWTSYPGKLIASSWSSVK